MNNRIGYLDFLRGIAIITVVMGHIIQYNFSGAASVSCFNFIYSFHMGFFFFISGCTAALVSQRNTWSNFVPFVKKKALQLLVPYFIWGLFIGGGTLLIINNISLVDIWHKLLLNLKKPSVDAPWFIFQLFFIQIVYYLGCSICERTTKKYALPIVLLCSVPLLTGFLWLKKGFIGTGYVWINPEYLLLFVLGHIAQTNEINEKITKIGIFISFMVFLFTYPFFDFQSGDSLTNQLIRIVASISFSLAIYWLVKMHFSSINEKARYLINYLGTHTLEIYLTHFCIINLASYKWIDTGLMNSIPFFLVLMIASIPICLIVIVISDILKAIPAMSVLLYGKVKQ